MSRFRTYGQGNGPTRAKTLKANKRSAEHVRMAGASHRRHACLAGRASARRDLVSRRLPLLA